MNNSQYVYMMVDAVSIISMMDTTEDAQDHCTIYLYFNAKGIRVTVFGDNTKFCESTNSPGTPLSWNPISCPSGLSASPGFGSSPDTPSPDHRMYEFRIPLNTIGAAAGDTIYFASPFDVLNSLPFDYNGGASRYNIWPPSATTSDLSTWGQIQLADSLLVPTLNEWGMIIFTVLAELGAIVYLRKQKTAKS